MGEVVHTDSCFHVKWNVTKTLLFPVKILIVILCLNRKALGNFSWRQWLFSFWNLCWQDFLFTCKSRFSNTANTSASPPPFYELVWFFSAVHSVQRNCWFFFPVYASILFRYSLGLYITSLAKTLPVCGFFLDEWRKPDVSIGSVLIYIEYLTLVSQLFFCKLKINL